MCTENWAIGNFGIACVEVTGEIMRPLAADTTADEDSLCDFTIDYIAHIVKI